MVAADSSCSVFSIPDLDLLSETEFEFLDCLELVRSQRERLRFVMPWLDSAWGCVTFVAIYLLALRSTVTCCTSFVDFFVFDDLPQDL